MRAANWAIAYPTRRGRPSTIPTRSSFAGGRWRIGNGPLATAWHSNKFLNPARDGVVLPILHLNGYKINNPTCCLALATRTGESIQGLWLHALLCGGVGLRVDAPGVSRPPSIAP
jgi:hypothetical protein